MAAASAVDEHSDEESDDEVTLQHLIAGFQQQVHETDRMASLLRAMHGRLNPDALATFGADGIRERLADIAVAIDQVSMALRVDTAILEGLPCAHCGVRPDDKSATERSPAQS